MTAMENTEMDADIIIVGAGPAGLCLATTFSGRQLKTIVIEQQAQQELEAPAFDGREIALTQHSAKLLQTLGVWQKIDPGAIAPLRDAKVMDGPTSPHAMVIRHELGRRGELGWLVSNHLIRHAAYQTMQQAMLNNRDITLLAGEKLLEVRTNASQATVQLASGRQLNARLVVAADSRFSATRRMMGIAAQMHDFGKTMLVCCMTHEQPHDSVAWEWFDYGQTLALLPMNPDPATGAHRSSVVITLPSHETEPLLRLQPEAFGHNVTQRFQGRLGAMALARTRHAYPLVSVFPERLVGTSFAAVGDAAVGMHPVTAHGFNFGLLSIETLTQELEAERRGGASFAGDAMLQRYERRQKRATLPLFWATRFIIEIYTRESAPAKLARTLLLRLGQRFTPLKQSIAQSLAGG